MSDEAVEAAARAEFAGWPTYGSVRWRAAVRRRIRATLEAAAPHMLREAQELAWAKGATSAGMNLMALQVAGINPNPYRNQS